MSEPEKVSNDLFVLFSEIVGIILVTIGCIGLLVAIGILATILLV